MPHINQVTVQVSTVTIDQLSAAIHICAILDAGYKELFHIKRSIQEALGQDSFGYVTLIVTSSTLQELCNAIDVFRVTSTNCTQLRVLANAVEAALEDAPEVAR